MCRAGCCGGCFTWCHATWIGCSHFGDKIFETVESGRFRANEVDRIYLKQMRFTFFVSVRLAVRRFVIFS